MLERERLISLGESLKTGYGINRDQRVWVEKVYFGGKDAVIRIGEVVFAITEKENGMTCIAAGQPLKNAQLSEEHGKWEITTLSGKTMETTVLL